MALSGFDTNVPSADEIPGPGQGFNANFAGHHLIPTAVRDASPLLDELQLRGLYKRGDFKMNGMFLPRNDADARSSGSHQVLNGGFAHVDQRYAELTLTDVEANPYFQRGKANTAIDESRYDPTARNARGETMHGIERAALRDDDFGRNVANSGTYDRLIDLSPFNNTLASATNKLDVVDVATLIIDGAAYIRNATDQGKSLEELAQELVDSLTLETVLRTAPPLRLE
jgi:hypothetical protein